MSPCSNRLRKDRYSVHRDACKPVQSSLRTYDFLKKLDSIDPSLSDTGEMAISRQPGLFCPNAWGGCTKAPRVATKVLGWLQKVPPLEGVEGIFVATMGLFLGTPILNRGYKH